MDENMPDDRMLELVSSDNKSFSVSRTAIRKSSLVNNMLKNLGLDEPGAEQQNIPIPDVTSNILEKVIEYCEHHKNDPEPVEGEQSTEISEWDETFLNVDQTTLFHLVMAANYMDIKSLLKVCAKVIANMIRGKSVDRMREIYNITSDYTPEEDEQLRRENAWCEIEETD